MTTRRLRSYRTVLEAAAGNAAAALVAAGPVAEQRWAMVATLRFAPVALIPQQCFEWFPQ